MNWEDVVQVPSQEVTIGELWSLLLDNLGYSGLVALAEDLQGLVDDYDWPHSRG